MSGQLFYRRKQAAALLDVSIMWLSRHAGIDGFPRPLRLSDGTAGYAADEIVAYIEQKKRERDAAAGPKAA